MTDIGSIYESRLRSPLYNTSYPISPWDWAAYRGAGPLCFDREKELSFYIPFCSQLCSFCEYTRMICPGEELHRRYISTVKSDVEAFVARYGDGFRLKGFDIGGGTPTVLSNGCFHELMEIFKYVVDRVETTEDFEPSIETTFETITPEKARMIAAAGIRRVSLGMQSSSCHVLKQNHRAAVQTERMKEAIDLLHRNGIRKVNLDLMYGLRGQKKEHLQQDLVWLEALQPEQVTLYELRTNMIQENPHLCAEELFEEYQYLYDGLIGLGYYGRFGQNTFTRSPDDMGVSSYLRCRMLDGVAYKGFGISAQSMCGEGIAYNVGKSSTELKSLIERSSYEEEFTYHLPP
ncbi:MAG: radical SAM protein [Bacteroides sp.]|nr:radical SAM protein [Bacteroides sp.]